MNMLHFIRLNSKHEIRLKQKARVYDGGIAKPGQTRRTQDLSGILKRDCV